MDSLIGAWTRVLVILRPHRPRLRKEAGQATTEYLGLAALGIAAIVVIGAALRVLGLDVVDWIRTQIGV
ncbi:MAG: hypothetical protein ACRDZW_02045 [Acidimicrobiales bacterium]